MNVPFNKTINFEDGAELEIEFEGQFYQGGHSWTFGLASGRRKETELSAIEFSRDGLTPAQVEYVEMLVDTGKLDDAAWEAKKR